jgi:hypothetical protein
MQIDPIYPGAWVCANRQDCDWRCWCWRFWLGVMQQAFDAVHSQNPDDWWAIQLAEGTSLFLKFGCPTDPSGLSDATPR